MKKLLCISALLILLDQSTKHLVRHFFADTLIVLIPGVLNIYSFHNTYLGWLGWLQGVVYEPSPLALIVLLHSAYVVILVIGYRYLCFLSKKNRPLLNAFFVLALAGMGGAFVDDMIFNGSWDFIYLFDAVILDLKDFYIFANIILLFVFVGLYIPQYFRLSKEQRRGLDFFTWIKNGTR
jgi:signal peptidase II